MNTATSNQNYIRELLRVHTEIAATLRDAEIELCYVERDLQLQAQVR